MNIDFNYLKRALISSLGIVAISVLAGCGGGSGGDSSSEIGTAKSPQIVLEGQSKIDGNIPVNADLSFLAKSIKDISTVPVNPINPPCEVGQEPKFSYLALVLKSGSETRTLNIPVTCNNIVTGYVRDLKAGNWSVNTTVYDLNHQPQFSSASNFKFIENTKSSVPLSFKETTTGPLAIKTPLANYVAFETVNVPAMTISAYKENFVYLVSSANDYIGTGKKYFYNKDQFSLSGFESSLKVQVEEPAGEWSSTIELPNSLSEIKAGIYGDLTRFPFHSKITGGFEWSGMGRGCNQSTSWVAVDQVTYEAGALKSIDYRFAQHCENNPNAALFGLVHWVSPLATVGADWQPDLAVLPKSGNYIYIDSEQGDYIGGGKDYLFTPNNAQVSVIANNNVLAVNIQGNTWWNGGFAVPVANKTLIKGSFTDLIRYPFHNPVLGGLDWGGDGRGCNQLKGWFVIDDVNYINGTLQAVDLRFEQHCEGDPAALRGKIHWVFTQ